MMLNSKAEDYHHHHYYKVSLLNQLIQMNYVIRCLEIFVINQQEQQHYHVLLTISTHVLIASLYQVQYLKEDDHLDLEHVIMAYNIFYQ